MIDHNGTSTPPSSASPPTAPSSALNEVSAQDRVAEVVGGLQSLEQVAAVAGQVEGTAAEAVTPGVVAKAARVPAGPVGAWWKPSFADLFLVALLLWSFASSSSGWSGLLLDGDSGWHIRTGEYVLDQGHVPHQDLYSFSKEGHDWYAWEWLSDVIWAGLHRAMGLKGVVWFAGVVIAAFAGILLRFTMWHGANPMVALLGTLIAVGAASIHYHARPHVLTLLLVPIYAWMIAADRKRESRWLWALIPLMILWTNLHGGFLIGIILAGAAMVGAAVEIWIGKDGANWSQVKRYALLVAGLVGATFFNPYTYQLHVHVAGYLSSDWIRNVIDEFRSPDFRGETMLQFEALLILGIITAANLIRRKQITEALWFLGFAHMALGSVRHVTIFVSVAAPWIGAELSSWWQMVAEGKAKNSIVGILDSLFRDISKGFRWNSIWAPTLLLALLAFDKPVMHWPKNYPDARFPVQLVEKYNDRILSERTLTTDQWGDYLIYRNYPKQKVFVDGRSDFYGPAVGNDYLALLQAQHNWAQILEKYEFTFALVPVEWPVTSLLKKEAGWAVLADDGKTVVLEKRPGAAGKVTGPKD